MKKKFILFFLFIAILACDKKTKVEKAVEEIPVEIEIERFDKAFFESGPSKLGELKQKYPLFFPAGNPDKVWIEKMQHPQWRELYNEVQKKFGDFSRQSADLEDLFRHMKFYYPKVDPPKVVTVIGEMDYHSKAIYADSLLVLSLELYLGKDHRFYTFPKYLEENFEERQLMPDVASAFNATLIPPPDSSLLSQMIYFGKDLYMKDLLLPEFSDAEKIGFRPDQIQWSKENESYIWRYMIENQLLYDTDSKLPNRFINPAPFSKFYLEIDNESPGRIGQWIGWQIVRSYMQNNEVQPQEMLKMDAKSIFENSRYKPAKNAE